MNHRLLVIGKADPEISRDFHPLQHHWGAVSYGSDGLRSAVAVGGGRLLQRNSEICGADCGLRRPHRSL